MLYWANPFKRTYPSTKLSTSEYSRMHTHAQHTPHSHTRINLRESGVRAPASINAHSYIYSPTAQIYTPGVDRLLHCHGAPVHRCAHALLGEPLQQNSHTYSLPRTVAHAGTISHTGMRGTPTYANTNAPTYLPRTTGVDRLLHCHGDAPVHRCAHALLGEPLQEDIPVYQALCVRIPQRLLSEQCGACPGQVWEIRAGFDAGRTVSNVSQKERIVANNALAQTLCPCVREDIFFGGARTLV